jgi:transcriptional regulator with XRE-family HTH domain
MKDLAAAAGISVTALGYIEHNDCFPTKKTIDGIARGLGVSVGCLLVFSVTEKDVPQEKREAFRCLATPLKVLLLECEAPEAVRQIIEGNNG